MAQQQNLSEFNRYLLNNRDLLIQKHQQYFGKSGPLTLRTIPVQPLIDYIYDIFSLARYRADERTNNKITASLSKNIADFIAQNSERWTLPFNADEAVEALTYCITHNDMFSVQYDVQKPQKNKGPTDKQETGDAVLNVQFRNDSNVDSLGGAVGQRLSGSRVGNKQRKGEGRGMNPEGERGGEAQLLRRSVRGRGGPGAGSGSIDSNSLQPGLENQFNDKSQLVKFSQNLDIVQKNARLAYLSFCKNQMSLGGNQTFDRLSQQASTMTIGKLLVYAKAYGMFNDKITKELLMQRFRRISDGKRCITFEKFYILLTELLAVDQTLFNRLQFYDQNLHCRLKFVKYPFYTQDQNPRELVANRGFSNKLTGHSGKTHDELKEQIALRRVEMVNLQRSMMRQAFRQDLRVREKGQMLGPRDLTTGRSRNLSIELSFIDKIVAPEENDYKYLGDYEMEHYRKGGETGVSSSGVLGRKHSIVDNIRKRIVQIQHSQSQVVRAGGKARRYPLY